jgi:hypothetical protein
LPGTKLALLNKSGGTVELEMISFLEAAFPPLGYVNMPFQS